MKFFIRCLALLPMTVAALDLNPQEGFKELEGVKIPIVEFSDGTHKVRWQPPVDWRMSYEEGRLLLLAKAFTHASLELRVVPRAAGDTAWLDRPDALVRYLAALLPKTASAPTVTGNNAGPFTIQGSAAKEILFDFQEPAHASRGSVSLVDLNDHERLVVVITAQQKDFEDVRAAAIESMFSWQEQ
jgi:hypothetical protein